MNIEVRKLEKKDNRQSFRSGDIEIDRFFIKFAGQNQFKHKIGNTYVAVDSESQTILGYATISVSSLNIDGLKLNELKKLPNYPLPIVRIARLGVDEQFQAQGIGKKLMQKMIYLAIEIDNLASCVGIFVDAKKDALSFYEKYGFEVVPVINGELSVKPTQTLMYLSMKTICKLL
jgi:ribosomal protein S18 acetylase RimI-like enzyme